jgi:hypothetical protein
MSEETIHLVIGRAVTDPEFCDLFFNNPDAALSDYDLTDDEKIALKGVTRDRFDSVQSELEERLSKAGFGPGSFSQYLKKWTGPDLNLSGITKTEFTVTDEF